MRCGDKNVPFSCVAELIHLVTDKEDCVTAGLHISIACFDTQHLNSKTRVTAACAITKFQLVTVASHLWVATHSLTCGGVMAV